MKVLLIILAFTICSCEPRRLGVVTVPVIEWADSLNICPNEILISTDSGFLISEKSNFKLK